MPLPSSTLLPSSTVLPGGVPQAQGEYTHSFPGVRPHARYDDNAWLTVTVAEASTRTGTYTNLVTATLDPAEIDASEPRARNITVNGATLPAGWYRFTFTDTDGETETLDPLWAGPGIRPTVQEVAALMPDRTTEDGGNEARTFNSDTTPTATEVNNLIDMALDSVEPRVPADAGAETMRAARHIVTLRTAQLVETGNWSDQIEPNQGRLDMWASLLELHTATLDTAVDTEDTTDHIPSAFSITTGLPDDMFERTGRVSRDPYCSPWTSY